MKIATIALAFVLGFLGLLETLHAVLGNGSALLATVTVVGTVITGGLVAVLDRLDRLLAKP